MKKLNMNEWEIIHWALSGEQIKEIQEKGKLIMNREQAIETLKAEIKLTQETRKQVEETINEATEEQKEMMKIIIQNSKIRENEETELLNKLEKDNEEYEIGFVRGERGE